MPELHRNQIEWNAPEPQKVSLAKPDYSPLADSMAYLSNVADDISRRQAKIQDDELIANLKLAETEMNQMIENASSADADYGSLSERALSKAQEVFNRYDEATRNRFNRDNSTYFDSLQLAVSEKILQKEAKQTMAMVDTNIPLWASQAVAKGTEQARKDGVNKIQTSLKGLASPEEIMKAVYRYNNMIDKTNLNNLITAGTEASLAKARSYINNPKKRPTLDPYEVSIFNARLNNAEKDLAKAKATAVDPVSLEIVNAYGKLSRAGATPAAKEMMRMVKSGLPIPVMRDDGKMCWQEYINTANLTEPQVHAIITKMKQYDDLNPEFESDKADYNAAIDEALIIYNKSIDSESSEQDEALSLLMSYANDPMFDYLDSGTQKQIRGYINSQLKARTEASFGEEQMIHTGLFYSAGKNVGNPVNELTRMLVEGNYRTTEERNLLNWAIGSSYREDKYAPYKENITQAMMGAADIWRNRFAKDMGKNTVSEFGLFNKVLLNSYRDAGKLQGTRLGLSNVSIEKAFSEWSAQLKRKGLYNTKITDDNAKEVYGFYEALVGGKLTDAEKAIVNEMSGITKTGQANRDWSPIRQAISGPRIKSTFSPAKMAGSEQQKNQELMKAQNVLYSSERMNKAAQELK